MSSFPRGINGLDIEISAGKYHANIASVGASLRTLAYDGRDLVRPFSVNALRPVFAGAMLVPWANRIGDGSYSFGGSTHQVALTESARGNALHGLAVWADWTVIEHGENFAVLSHRIVAQDGYPFTLYVSTRYELHADTGLTWQVSATNEGSAAAPYTTGSHAYLSAPEGPVDRWVLRSPARKVMEVDPERLLPTEVRELDDDEVFNFVSARPIGDTFIDNAFTALGEGLVQVEVLSASGIGVGMEWDAGALPWVQIHTGDRPEESLNRTGLAVEPMTSPPDAFRTGDDLVEIAPGATHTANWRVYSRED